MNLIKKRSQKIMGPSKKILYGPNGEVKFLHDDRLSPHMEARGTETKLRRASHVDPGSDLNEAALAWLEENTGCVEVLDLNDHPRVISEQFEAKWFADLLPSDGPVLGPFDTRQAALDAEVEWLNAHNFNC
jgi:hypothetical protein